MPEGVIFPEEGQADDRGYPNPRRARDRLLKSPFCGHGLDLGIDVHGQGYSYSQYSQRA